MTKRVQRAFLLCSSLLLGCTFSPRSTISPDPQSQPAQTPEQALDETWAAWTRARRPLQRGMFYRVSEDGAHVVIILANPARRLEPATLAALEPSLTRERRSPVGDRGSTVDLGLVLPHLGQTQLRSVLAYLRHHLQGDTREAYAWPLELAAARPSDAQLDLKVSASALASWARSAVRVGSLRAHASASLGLRELLEHPTTGVFRQGQLVLLALAQGASSCSLDPFLQTFAAHGDVIVGAVASAYTTVLVARHAPPEELGLEPMQLESMRSLLAQPRVLEQSHGLERLTDASEGWAPVWLGAGLEDTELGLLLLLADHALQVSSLGAEGRFAGFEDPGLRGNPARQQLAAMRARGEPLALSFDASRAGFVVEDEELRIYVPTRTGSLPPAFRNADGREFGELERQAHAFLASSSSHVLARAARYLIFAQAIAELSELAVCEPSAPVGEQGAWDELERLLGDRLAQLRAGQAELEGELKRQASRAHAALRKTKEGELRGLTTLLLQRPTQTAAAVSPRERKLLRPLIDEGGQDMLLTLLGRERVQALFEGAASSERLLVTPRSVTLQNPTAAGAVGGHLPWSALRRYALDDRVRVGRPRAPRKASSTITLHPNDADKLAELTLHVGAQTPTRSSALRAALADARSTARALDPDLVEGSATGPAGIHVGWRELGSERSEQLGDSLDAQGADRAVLLRRRGPRLEALVVGDRGGAGELLELGSLGALASYLAMGRERLEGARLLVEVEDSVGEVELRGLLRQLQRFGFRDELRVRPHAPDLQVERVRSFDTRWEGERLTLELRLDLPEDPKLARVLVLEGPCRAQLLFGLRGWIAARARLGIDASFFAELEAFAGSLGFELELALLNHLDVTFGGALQDG